MSDTRQTTDSMEDLDAPIVGTPMATPPTAKERTALQQAVSRLLDALAPDRPAARASRPPAAIEPHRTPRGCILQAATSAVSVSWFPEAADVALGELQIAEWSGVLSRPGSSHQVQGAVVVREQAFRPFESAPGTWSWRASDGTVYDTSALAAHCFALLDERSGDNLPADLAT
ncbi:MAG: hypothetical protein WKG32_12990 [Gemmatimonadaceae bacterium]